jgi:hypothetical protein
MPIDISLIDRAIAKLQELRKLAADPEIAPFLRNGNGATVSPNHETNPYELTDFEEAVITACKAVGGDFTVNTVLKKMEEQGYKFRGSEPRKSVANLLRGLNRDGHIAVKEHGKGRRETIYEGI